VYVFSEEITASIKTMYYRNVTTLLDAKGYIASEVQYLCKRALFNVRCSGHSLNMETGRYQHILR